MSDLRYYDQFEMVHGMFQEARVSEFSGRRLAGPHHGELTSALQAVTERLHEINPMFDGRHLMASAYTSNAVQRDIRRLPDSQSAQLFILGAQRNALLRAMGGSWARNAQPVVMDEGLLHAPDYARQGDDSRTTRKAVLQGCFNACFRMVFNGVTGDRLAESSVAQAIDATYNNHLIDDEEYLKVFATPRLTKQYGVTAKLISITGADLATIAKVARAVKAQDPNRKTQCIVGMQTEISDRQSTWHTNVLLAANETSVMVHDPSDTDNGKARRIIDRAIFHERWAGALNRAHIIISE